ncbi:M35 family metallo-endopeptidase [Methylobacterium sp. WSM2598]|uniref:M35 family metallo-endopeptidase n=1 Tax=Methylobacterium sp. WSM2598 TaxID=398261 RepID=UPI000A039527|nr:M35 family metallo-endopeptidase [Methylobacterium sp. WSM2598]
MKSLKRAAFTACFAANCIIISYDVTSAQNANQVVRDVEPIFSKCTETEKDKLKLALNKSRELISSAFHELSNKSPAERSRYKLYVVWFGTYSPERYESVVQTVSKIQRALQGVKLTFLCRGGDDCERDDYAYADEPSVIGICKNFWSKMTPTTGADSRAGTLIHEISHLTHVAGTDDATLCGRVQCSGQVDAKFLARNRPGLAVKTADNYQYFVENTPEMSEQ